MIQYRNTTGKTQIGIQERIKFNVLYIILCSNRKLSILINNRRFVQVIYCNSDYLYRDEDLRGEFDVTRVDG
jgi:hypothetical protein